MTGQKLRLLREYRNYSQEYIAEKLGITQNAYSRIENNQTRLTAERLEKLAITGTAGLMLLVYHAEPDSPSADGLALLANLADHRTEPARRNAATERTSRISPS